MSSDKSNYWQEAESVLPIIKTQSTMRIIDRILPSEAILYLFQKEKDLGIKIVIEKTSKGQDYVIIEHVDNDRWAYIFQLLLDKLCKRFNPAPLSFSFYAIDYEIFKTCSLLRSLTP